MRRANKANSCSGLSVTQSDKINQTNMDDYLRTAFTGPLMWTLDQRRFYDGAGRHVGGGGGGGGS